MITINEIEQAIRKVHPSAEFSKDKKDTRISVFSEHKQHGIRSNRIVRIKLNKRTVNIKRSISDRFGNSSAANPIEHPSGISEIVELFQAELDLYNRHYNS